MTTECPSVAWDRNSREPRAESQERTVDLKWSLWSASLETWKERAPEVAAMLASLPEGCDLTIKTAPRKETRTGSVTIHRGDDGFTASGHFTAEWDSIPDLETTLDMPEGALELCAAWVPHSERTGEPGVDRTFTVEATGLAELLALVDAEEAGLIVESNERFAELEVVYGP